MPGIEENLNAGMWSIGVSVSGNEVGLSLEEWRALPEAEPAVRRSQAHRRLSQAAAPNVVDDVSQVRACVDDIGLRLAREQRP